MCLGAVLTGQAQRQCPRPRGGRLHSAARVVVMTDIANEPDDQMSMVRFLVYANHFDVEGLVATTSTWMKNRVRPDVIRTLLDAYARVQPNLPAIKRGFRRPMRFAPWWSQGNPRTAWPRSAGPHVAGRRIDRARGRPKDARPLWVLAWGGTNTLAQALWHVRATRTPEQVDELRSRLRVYTISDQDDAGPWLRREFPALHYIAMPSTQDGEEYASATWTGISGDRFYRNAAGADFTTLPTSGSTPTFARKGPLGALYPYPCCIHEGERRRS